MHKLIISITIASMIIIALIIPYIHVAQQRIKLSSTEQSNELMKKVKEVLNRSISIDLRIYKLLPNGTKELVYSDPDPPTKNLYELMLAFLGGNGKIITTSGQELNEIYHVQSKKICVGTGSSTSPYSTTNLVQTLSCTSNVLTNFTETNSYAIAVIKGLIFFTSNYTITEVGYIMTYHSAERSKTVDVLMLYDNVNIDVSPASPLLIEYVINVSYTPPLTTSYWHLIFSFGLGVIGQPFAADVVYLYDTKLTVHFCPYFSYSASSTTSNLPTTCISGDYILSINTSTTPTAVSISYWISPPSKVELGTVAIEISIARDYWYNGGWLPWNYAPPLLIIVSPISSSNSVVLSWSEWMKLNVEVRVG